MLLLLSTSYRQQHGFNSVVLVPGNVYGEHDNFNLEAAHVVPAMLRKFVEAREPDQPSVTFFGSGRPMRDFVYAGDVAALVPHFITRVRFQRSGQRLDTDGRPRSGNSPRSFGNSPATAARSAGTRPTRTGRWSRSTTRRVCTAWDCGAPRRLSEGLLRTVAMVRNAPSWRGGPPMNVFVLGGQGFVGSAFVRAAAKQGHAVTAITRQNYEQWRGRPCDLLVNANGNSKKFLAEREPAQDFDASVVSVLRSLLDFPCKRLRLS